MSTRLARYKGKVLELNNGYIMPALGLGTFQDPDEQETAVYTALKCGYRHIDTAYFYGTERQVGRGIRRSGVPREEIFLTTKLWNNAHHPDDVEPALDESLKALGTDYVDLYLMHFPCAFKRGPELLPFDENGKLIPEPSIHFVDTWRAMEMLVKAGKARAIGVSNFSKAEIERLLEEGSVVPAVHQMEMHPYLQQPEFASWLNEKGIRIVQFSPCANLNPFYSEASRAKDSARMTRLVHHPVMLEVAKKHGRSAIQIALAWAIQNGRSVIPKSTIEWQIRENAEAGLITLDQEDLDKIERLDCKARFNDPSVKFGYKLHSGLDGAAP
ncbi:uncharacterized protein E0L32_009896 [Thyridium curvatum]|uniref:NADP-dependent oxidoreductase domain-containing protein n=1 Tax=Thyridium curvatum TaxID=1093900 RepID=A0A507AN48_9PEZI|nr:uncharacterized protein E0L32_009896 [Thyridium curvatum]TPX08707.1 hypothetical protein E0L32_009896 [Thyridium curvatum]